MSITHGRLVEHKVAGADTGAFQYVREVSFDTRLEMRGGGEATQYMLHPCTFNPGEECSFTLRVFSDQPAELEEHQR